MPVEVAAETEPNGIEPQRGISNRKQLLGKQTNAGSPASRKRYICEQCESLFPTAGERRLHRAKEHSNERVMKLPSGIKYRFFREGSTRYFTCICNSPIKYTSLTAHSKICHKCKDTSIISNVVESDNGNGNGNGKVRFA
ncbi:hypothetical protein GGI12_002022 [Dipsacomyces acuminosporus]|nr:hypothetical protein GGI12_002022 [Dipsacomyces acuminosporus]